MFDTYEDIFAERANSYQAAMARWPDARDAEFAALIERLGTTIGKRVCDMPAGGGYLRRHLSPGTRYVAIEPTAYFHAACPRDENADALLAPIEAIPLPDRSVDHVVSLAGLHHVANLPAVFGEMRRLLPMGGRAIICDVAVSSASAIFLNGFVDRHNPMGHDGAFLDEATVPALGAAGFEIVADEAIVTPWTFADVLEAGSFCARLFGIEGLSDAEIGQAMDREIGFVRTAHGVALQWPLRRIVASAR